MDMRREMHCPYCGKRQKVKSFDGIILLLSLLTGMVVIYLLYCAVNGSRICMGCNRRIYEMKGSIEQGPQHKREGDL